MAENPFSKGFLSTFLFSLSLLLPINPLKFLNLQLIKLSRPKTNIPDHEC